MVLRAICACAAESTVEHSQLPDLVDVESLPSMRRTALTLAADLKAAQAFDVTSDPVVVRLDDSDSSGFVNELDETSFDDRPHEIVIHYLATQNLPSKDQSTRRAIFWRFDCVALSVFR
jgi:hypothetical protein